MRGNEAGGGRPARSAGIEEVVNLFKAGSTGLALGVVGFAILLGAQPPSYEVSRTVMIEAPPAAVFARINDFHQWESWSPWAKDPALQARYVGPKTGVGAIFDWSGTPPVGSGRMTIVESEPPQRVGIALEVAKPFPATAEVAFDLTPHGPGTAVTWTIRGEYTLVARGLALLKGGMDQAIGPDLERGLAQLRAAASAPRPAPAEAESEPPR